MEIILNRIRKSKFFNIILNLVGIVGLDKVCVRLMYLWIEKHPTDQMKDSLKYYDEHEKEIIRIKELLADDKSRKVWRQAIEFRKTMNYKEHPGKENDQYFVNDIIKLEPNEVFIDCGGYDGATSLEFMRRCEGKFKQIVIFEPDYQCKPMLKKNIPEDKRIKVIFKGGWSKTTNIRFISSGDSASHVAECTNIDSSDLEVIPVIAMDECEICRDATFIKMDLEGSEIKALQGAKKLILKNKPKLAICIYHSDEDMTGIIDYIHDLVPDYKLYVRHHSVGVIETVVYAII